MKIRFGRLCCKLIGSTARKTDKEDPNPNNSSDEEVYGKWFNP